MLNQCVGSGPLWSFYLHRQTRGPPSKDIGGVENSGGCPCVGRSSVPEMHNTRKNEGMGLAHVSGVSRAWEVGGALSKWPLSGCLAEVQNR